jgi:signal transduction histidine kinase
VRLLRSALFWRILLSSLLVVSVLGIGMFRATRAHEHLEAQFDRLVQLDLKLADDAEVLLRMSVDMETGKRGFLLTGDRAFLAPYERARSDIDRVLGEAMDTADADEEVRLRDTQRLTHEWIDQISEPQILARERGEAVGGADSFLEAKSRIDDIRALLEGVRTDAIAEARGREDEAFRSVTQSRRETTGILLVALVLALASGVWIARDLGGAASRLQDAIDATGRLEPLPELPDRSDELGAVGRHLKKMATLLADKDASLRRTLAEREATLEELARANRVKTEFLASMSHELRTPLNAILGFADLLLDSPREHLSPRSRESLERIQKNGTHLLTLINDVLDLAKIESGNADLRFAAVDVIPLLRACPEELDSLRIGKNLELRVEAPDHLEMVTDGQRLRQIVLNLLSNALKFTDEGEVLLSIEAGDDEVKVAVKDTGVGIPAHSIGELFQDFRQLDAGDGRRFAGTGIGLALSRRFARALGGDITVISTEGKGSTFTLVLPRRKSPESVRAAERREVA